VIVGRSPSEKTIESVPRDTAVKAVGVPDPLSINSRVGARRVKAAVPERQSAHDREHKDSGECCE
jgi:hypothetical protein